MSKVIRTASYKKPVTKINWAAALLSLLLAIAVWYTITGRDRVDTWVNVRLETKGIKDNYIILNPLPREFHVRLRGPAGLIRNISSQPVAAIVNLSAVNLGKNTIPSLSLEMPFSSAFDIMEIKPAQFEVSVDELWEKTVPINITTPEDLPQNATNITFEATSNTVKLKGPSSILSKLASINVQPEIPKDIASANFTAKAFVLAPEGVEANPMSVQVNAAVKGGRKTITLFLPIAIRGKNIAPESFAEPAKVRVALSVPLEWSDGGSKMKEIRAFVNGAGKAKKGGKVYKINLETPPEAKVLSVLPPACIIFSP